MNNSSQSSLELKKKVSILKTETLAYNCIEIQSEN